MTLLIAVLLLLHMDAEWWAYVVAVVVWCMHVSVLSGK